MDTRLTNAGIHLDEIESRLDGQGKSLVITASELVFVDESGLQRAPLRQVTKVAIDKTGSLSIRSATSDLIMGNIRGFDLTSLKFFLENAKSSIAKAKTAAKSPTIIESAPVIPVPMPAAATTPRSDMGTLSDDAWGQDPALRQPTFDTWSNVKPSDMQTKSSSEMHKSFEIAPDDDVPAKSLAEKLEWAEEVETPPASMMASPHEVLQTQVSMQPELSSTDVHSEVQEWNESFKAPEVEHAGSETQPSNIVNSHGTADWSGDILEPSNTNQQLAAKSAGNEINVSKDPTPTIDRPVRITNLPNLSPIGRWLRILAPLVGLLGVAGAALLFPMNIDKVSENPLQLVAAIASLFVGVMLALIAYGLAELFTAWSALAADVRSLKREKLG
jgi:hypothetical protein